MKNKLYRRGFGLKREVAEAIKTSYSAELINKIKANNNQLTIGNTTIKLAKEFGFCYGVDRAIDYTLEALYKFPNKRIFLSCEMIHNPNVNKDLYDKGVRFLSGKLNNGESLEDVTKDDVIILPAFGISTNMLEELKSLDCILVDTTCGSVINVWKHVKRFSRKGFTAVIHGKYYHEETVATASYAVNKKYIIVRDLDEAQMVCNYILDPKDKEGFMNYFKNAISSQFNPDIDLDKISVANQTTMLSNESLQVAEMLKNTSVQKYGKDFIEDHFRSFDTICSATQDRQDAIIELLKGSTDLTLVIGGFNSSNTMNLANISGKFNPTYHITDAECLINDNAIKHKSIGKNEIEISSNWLPKSELTIAVTAGASTPNSITGKVIEKVFNLRGETF